MKNIFEKQITDEVIGRINQLTATSKPLWGKMSVGQMLAHCSVTYEFVYEDKHKTPDFLLKLILKWFVKDTVVTEKPYKKSSQTAPEFIITDNRDFVKEKQRLIAFIQKTQELGSSYFNNKESRSFGVLTVNEWNIMFYKHLDHHLSQFGV